MILHLNVQLAKMESKKIKKKEINHPQEVYFHLENFNIDRIKLQNPLQN